MTLRYVGEGGNDGNTGLSWVQRKLTLNGVEDTPVVAGDTIYVGPGAYREKLTVDVSGAAGSLITYIGDVTGAHTDGVGGLVRITGSDNDQTRTRDHCIEATSKNYRTFQGFYFGEATSYFLHITTGATGWSFFDCSFYHGVSAYVLYFSVNAECNHTIERCVFYGFYGSVASDIYFNGAQQDIHTVIRNCLFCGAKYYNVYSNGSGGVTVQNCSIVNVEYSAFRAASFPAGYTPMYVYNCQFTKRCTLTSNALGQLIEDYNSINESITRTNVAVGANTAAIPIVPAMPLLLSGYCLPFPGTETHSKWSVSRALPAVAGSTDDYRGRSRPSAASGKQSRGAIQYNGIERDSVTTRGASSGSLKLADSGRHQLWVPVSAVSTTFSVYVYREADYAGTSPSMIIKQPGQADTVITDVGAAEVWNPLTATLTPAAAPRYVVIELLSENTAIAGSYATYFDDLGVS